MKALLQRLYNEPVLIFTLTALILGIVVNNITDPPNWVNVAYLVVVAIGGFITRTQTAGPVSYEKAVEAPAGETGK